MLADGVEVVQEKNDGLRTRVRRGVEVAVEDML